FFSNTSLTECPLYCGRIRLVDEQKVENNSGGSAFLALSNESGVLPFGCYVILLEEEGENLLRRKVLVIE
ncbi:MAG: hypothetical protein KAH31_09310, partial [Candidatus Sabulitectum sp.]|nr:hypothetical protein [Candidatus Sabulitectum sp.]